MDTTKTINFIREVYGTNDFIPLHAPVFQGNEKKYLNECIDSTFVSSVGKFVDQFENQMQEITGASKAVAVVNGTASLQIALRLVGVRPGEEVITQALTFVATANAIVYNGADPVFLDVDKYTLGLSPSSVKRFLEEHAERRSNGCYNKRTGRRIAACMPVHTFGFPVRIDELIEVCSGWDIPVVEDAAEAIGSYYKGKHTGTFGAISGFSFNGNKIVTSGGGGAIITNDVELGIRAKHITTTAKKPHPYEFYHDEIGFNFRMPNINAALACAQLEMLDKYLKDKRKLANDYALFFDQMGVKFCKEPANSKSNYWLMAVELENKTERDKFLKETNDHGIMTRPVWQLMYRLPMFTNCYRDDQINAEFLEERIVNLPSMVTNYSV
ncbi:MAG: LegC family aminotransferase [Brumimicrobium sp.]|nr:LegC family aminotransferase [Brumimicrobium sp.]